MKKQLAVVLLALMMLFGPALSEAQATAISATPATVSLNYAIGESITVSAAPGSVTFTGAPPTTGTIAITTTWVAGATRTTVNVNWGLGSVTAALALGSNNIPASKVFANLAGAGYQNCTQASAGDSTLTGMLTVGAICNNGVAQALTTANDAGSRTDNLVLQLQGLGALPAGTYNGTLTIVADLV